MSQPQPQQYDPLLVPLQRKWNIMTSGLQEVAEFLTILTSEIQRLRMENEKLVKDNADLKKLFEDKKAQTNENPRSPS